ncbi:MAG: disulfide bond formation protein B [Sphingopyxis sp.]|jgi:disulfide bond formation protein DsbB|uniref:disulfide bond formation protein B n=1 Tax=Sphingopyxis sp. TaxID=1908224 RepID=UPI002AB91390|nr:disulfide bond formation protein B [Sphingopyxis sp.]MDZ3831964.1 disulfide bond formation protein B [Sphingopyxis sp.]
MTTFQLLAPRKWRLLAAAWIVALASSLAVLFIGEVMGQAPCNLCWFQRAFMFPLAIILGLATFRSDRGVLPYAGALALFGWLIAFAHLILYVGIIPTPILPCGEGPSCSGESMAIGGIPIPLLSLAAFSLILTLLLLFQRRLKS